MRAAWYDRTGAVADVLVVGEIPTPDPGPGELRIALRASGVNVGDIKKRAGWTGAAMPYPCVIPHSDGAGVVDRVGPGIAESRLGERVWCYGAQSYRPFGTAAQYVVVPSGLAVPLPEAADFDVGACLGIPGVTAHRAVLGDGPVDGRTVLVSGATGAVGSIATALAHWSGARVLATVRRPAQCETALALGADHVFLAAQPDLVAVVRSLAPDGVDRVVEVAFDANSALDSEILAVGGVIACYASTDPEPRIPYWPLAFGNATVRLLGSDDFPPAAKAQAARDLNACLSDGALRVTIAARFPLERIADAHEAVAAGSGGRVILTI